MTPSSLIISGYSRITYGVLLRQCVASLSDINNIRRANQQKKKSLSAQHRPTATLLTGTNIVCISAPVCVCVCVCQNIYICVCVCEYMCVHARRLIPHVHTPTYLYTHTCTCLHTNVQRVYWGRSCTQIPRPLKCTNKAAQIHCLLSST